MTHRILFGLVRGFAASLAVLVFAQMGAGAQTAAGTALSFDGVDDFVAISNSPALNLYPLTIMAWFRNGDANVDRGLVTKYVSNALNGYQIYFYQGTLRAWY